MDTHITQRVRSLSLAHSQYPSAVLRFQVLLNAAICLGTPFFLLLRVTRRGLRYRMAVDSKVTGSNIIMSQGPAPPNPMMVERFQSVVSSLFQQVWYCIYCVSEPRRILFSVSNPARFVFVSKDLSAECMNNGSFIAFRGRCSLCAENNSLWGSGG